MNLVALLTAREDSPPSLTHLWSRREAVNCFMRRDGVNGGDPRRLSVRCTGCASREFAKEHNTPPPQTRCLGSGVASEGRKEDQRSSVQPHIRRSHHAVRGHHQPSLSAGRPATQPGHLLGRCTQERQTQQSPRPRTVQAPRPVGVCGFRIPP